MIFWHFWIVPLELHKIHPHQCGFQLYMGTAAVPASCTCLCWQPVTLAWHKRWINRAYSSQSCQQLIVIWNHVFHMTRVLWFTLSDVSLQLYEHYWVLYCQTHQNQARSDSFSKSSNYKQNKWEKIFLLMWNFSRWMLFWCHTDLKHCYKSVC